MSEFSKKLKKAKRREATVDICLRGDLAGQYEDLEKELAELPTNNQRLGGDPERDRITAEMERLRAEMQEGTETLKLRALPETAFQRLMDEHPPRRKGDDVDPADYEFGYNRATFWPALIQATVYEPEIDDAEWIILFGDALSRGEMMKLRDAANLVNGQAVDVPFSPAASSENQA